MHSVIIACTITTLITTYIYIASFKFSYLNNCIVQLAIVGDIVTEWNRKFNDILITNGFKRSENDPCLYSSQENGEWMYISIHVDDLIVAAMKDYMFKEFEKRMGHTLNIKNLGDLKYYLGIQFERDENGIFLLHQKGYIERKLDKFNLTDSRPSNIP